MRGALERLAALISVRDGVDLASEAEGLFLFYGRPWDMVTPGAPVAEGSPYGQLDAASAPGAWVEAVTAAENAIPQWLALPDAWDGAINFQKESGNLSMFDGGPLWLVYNHLIGFSREAQAGGGSGPASGPPGAPDPAEGG